MNLRYLVFAVLLSSQGLAPADDSVPDYARDVAPLLRKYCAGCHGTEEQNGELRLDEYSEMLKGGEHGPALLAGDAKLSRMMRALRGEVEAKMPPKEEKQPTAEEVALFGRWIDAGAQGPEGGPDPAILVTPKLAAAAAKQPITAVAFSPDGKWLAVARYGEVELRNVTGKGLKMADDDVVIERRLGDHPGKVNDLAFSSDGKLLLAATGVAGLFGEMRMWNVADGSLASTLKGHRDVLYAVAISHDGKHIATGSYDRRVIVWDRASGEKQHEFTQHNGAIYDLAFSPDGNILASASADETIKLWHVEQGIRLDTLGQPQGAQFAVLFSPDGQQIIAGGADNRIRVWRLVSRDKPEINPLQYARFAHEEAIVALAWAPATSVLVSAAADRTLKLWETKAFTQTQSLEAQSDVVNALAAAPTEGVFVAARMDGTLGAYVPWAVVQTEVDGHAPSDEVVGEPGSGEAIVVAEIEPNDAPDGAAAVTLPATASGAIHDGDGSDADLYRFAAKRGQTWIIETKAQQLKSPLDTHVEVLDAAGQRIERVKLQAVRDSYFTFRGKDSIQANDFRVHNWEEMKLNQLLYANGEVVKLFLYPRGPDSGFNVYPNFGQRYAEFDTTPLSHDLGAPCYIVEPLPPDAKLIPNGLPVFPLYWENDDESQRKLGADSKLTFTAPADGEYLVRVKDRRGFQGENYKYELTIRPPRPDFSVSVEGAGPTVNRGSGKMFKLNAGRDDNFDGEIRIDIANVPPGFYVTTPLTIEASHWNAHGAIYAFTDAAEPAAEAWNNVKITATAKINGKEVVKEIGNLGAVKLADAPKILASLSPIGKEPAPPGQIPELEIQRGETITATLRIARNGHNDVVAFGTEGAGRNLPHGVYVDNIGLNGVLLLADQNERTVFITADDWVPSTSRLFFLKCDQDDGQCTWPVRLIVK